MFPAGFAGIVMETPTLALDLDADCIGECDCCGKQGPLIKTTAFGIDTSACDTCRGECDEATRLAAIERFTKELPVLLMARMHAKTLYVRAMLTDGIDDLKRKISDIKEGLV